MTALPFAIMEWSDWVKWNNKRVWTKGCEMEWLNEMTFLFTGDDNIMIWWKPHMKNVACDSLLAQSGMMK